MASAIVPSRAKATGRPAMPTTSTPTLPTTSTTPAASATTGSNSPTDNKAHPATYVRLTLTIHSLHGASLSPPPTSYFLRCMRGGRPVKLTAAKSIPPNAGTFNEKISLYAHVRRPARHFTVDADAEPLTTTFHLCTPNPPPSASASASSDATVVAHAPFDIGHYLEAIVDANTRSQTITLPFTPADITARVTLSIKALGENHLAPYNPPPPQQEARRNAIRATTPRGNDADEVEAALEIERLRRQNAPHPSNHAAATDVAASSAERPALPPLNTSDSALATPSVAPSAPITPKTPGGHLNVLTNTAPAVVRVPSGGDGANATTAALQARVRQLEEENANMKRINSEAENKVAAHVAHARKIKETYTQLAGWYNNLREDHVELQKRLPPTGDESQAPPRADSNASSATLDSDLKKVEEERDSLQSKLLSERNENRELQTRNSKLLETTKTLADLREQWEAAQATIQRKEHESEERAVALHEAEQTIVTLRGELAGKNSQVEEKDTALSEANVKVKEMEETHERAMVDLKSSIAKEEELSDMLAQIRASRAEEVENAVKEAIAAAETKRSTDLEQLRIEKDEEIAQVRQNVSQHVEADKEEQLSRIRELHESALEEQTDALNKKIEDSETLARELREAVDAADGRHKHLESELEAMKIDYERRLKEVNDGSETREERLREELEVMAKEKKELSKQMEILRESSNLDAQGRASESHQVEFDTVKLLADCDDLRNQVKELQKENDYMRSSPRQIDATANGGTEVSDLRQEIAELKLTLRTESTKRAESATLLENADREHDELRDMVTRLRHERDTAQDEGKKAQQELYKIRSARPPLPGQKPDSAQPSLEEQRDKAIREVFRIRKGLNKQIRALKDEVATLRQSEEAGGYSDRGLSDEPGSSSQLSEELTRAVTERDQAMSDLQKAKDDLSRAESEFAAEGAAREKSAQEKLSALESEIQAHKAQVDDLESSLSNARKDHDAQLHHFEQEKDVLLKKIVATETTAEKSTKALEQKNDEIRELTQKVQTTSENVEESEQNIAAVTKERDTARNRCSALEAELMALKKSLDDVSSSTSSTENSLRNAEKENAEMKAEVVVVRGELEKAQKAHSDKEAELQSQLTRLRNEVSHASSATKQQEGICADLQVKLTDYRSQLEEERALKEKECFEKEELQGSLENLRSKHSILTAKVGEEQSLRKDVEAKLTELDGKLVDAEAKVAQMDAQLVDRHSELTQMGQEKEAMKKTSRETKERIASAEAQCREQEREIKSLQDKLASAESARQILQQEASDAGGESQRVVEELNLLRGELEKSRDAQRDTSAKLDAEIAKGVSDGERYVNEVNEWKIRNGNVVAECTSLRTRNGNIERELKEVRGTHAALRSELEDMRRQCGELQTVVEDREKATSNALNRLSTVREDGANTRKELAKLETEHEELQQTLNRVKGDVASSEEEREILHKRALDLEKEVGELHERVRSMHGEHEARMAAERAHAEREGKKTTEMRKDLRSTRALVETLQENVEKLQSENEELRKHSMDGREQSAAGDQRDSLLNDLISNRLELAYAQDEIIRLRNKLKKATPKASGSSSFEY